jgi:nucleoside-diphosphate-sugar epimerase
MKKRILITGSSGFIGSHLSELCVKKGFKVTAFDRYNSNYSLGNLEKSYYKKDINFVFGDIRDYDSVEKVVKNLYQNSFYNHSSQN